MRFGIAGGHSGSGAERCDHAGIVTIIELALGALRGRRATVTGLAPENASGKKAGRARDQKEISESMVSEQDLISLRDVPRTNNHAIAQC
jgi:hypothetical protein